MPAALRAAALASQSPHAFLEFLTITHLELATPIRVVNNPVAITRGGNVYQPFAFAVELPSEKDGEISDAKLSIDAVDLSIILAIRSISSRASVSIVIALADAPDSTEVDLGTFEWKDITYNKFAASGSLSYEDRLDILVPALCFTPTYTPGAF